MNPIFRIKNVSTAKLAVVLLLILAGMGACRKVLIYNSKYKIVSREIDNSLADSVWIVGKVVSAIDTTSPISNARIWVNELSKDTHSDLKGNYTLKLPGGNYTLNSREEYSSNEFQQTIKNLSLSPNEKIEINFYLGGKVE